MISIGESEYFLVPKYGRMLEVFRSHALRLGIPDGDWSRFHEIIPSEKMPHDVLEGTAHTYGHDLVYALDQNFRQAGIIEPVELGFRELYIACVKQILGKNAKKYAYQRMPSLRVHYPGYTSYGVFHTDAGYNHPLGEVNFWIPITYSRDSASMYIESEIGKGDYQPVNCDPGYGFMFDGSLKHGNVINEPGLTGVSFDFRIISLDKIMEFIKSSLTAKKSFNIQDPESYYARF